MDYCNFSESDFKNCQPSCSQADLQSELLERLQYARALCGFSFMLTSAYRSPDYEHSKGRTGSSSHCKGLAVDIACLDDKKRYNMVQNLLRAGFFRIGIGKNFIHADCDYSKPASIWLY